MTAAKRVVTYLMGITVPITKLCRVAQKSYLCYWMWVEIVNFALSAVAILVPHLLSNAIRYIQVWTGFLTFPTTFPEVYDILQVKLNINCIVDKWQ